jgi:hypothetical protein
MDHIAERRGLDEKNVGHEVNRAAAFVYPALIMPTT